MTDSADSGREAEKGRIVDEFVKASEKDRIEGEYSSAIRTKWLFILGMLLLCFAAAVCSIAFGSVDIPLADTLKSIGHALFPWWIDGASQPYYDDIIVNSRFPRTFLCLLTGVSLAAAGTIMQGLLRNPLVSPFTLGVSTAASFGAALSIVFFPAVLGSFYYESVDLYGFDMTVKNLLIVVLSFCFGMTSILLVLKISRKDATRTTLILSGVVISYLFQAGISLSQYISDDESLRTISNWLMGGMWNATWGAIIIIVPVVVPCLIYLEKISMDINSLSAGDDIAKNVGVNVQALRRKGLVISTLITSVCVAFSGVIGFIGLMAPHMTRMVIGNDSRFVLPASALMGASILLFADIVSRKILYPDQLPVGIILYVVGGIFFIWMVTRKNWGSRL
ncbi:MAG: iron ABC transporter permease [Candidatus Methanomethylophilaceae archaeon]|nr:iron ABC transporter permease [Candidatus Methanomethylophilaceae archaeon]